MTAARSRHHIRAEQRRFRRAKAGKDWSLRDLPQFYYLSNFKSFLTEVQARHFDLLGRDHLDFITQFDRLPKGAQATYVRMANRRGYVFDREKFTYSEIPDQDAHWQTLLGQGFADRIDASLFRDWLFSLTKPDLTLFMAESLCETLFKKSWKKPDLIDVACQEIDPDDVSVPDRYVGQGHRNSLQYLLYLYFGRIEDNLQSLTHRDLGLSRFAEDLPKTPIFDDINEARTAFFYAQALHDFKNGSDYAMNDLINQKAHWPDPICEQSLRHRDKLLQKLGGWSERNGRVDDALCLYEQSDAPISNERVIRIRWKRDEGDDRDWCKSRLEALVENPASDQEADFAEDFYARKFRQKRTSATTDLLRTATVLTLDEAFRNQPERATLRHFKAKGIEAYRTENVPWRTLFGLLFWDLLHKDGPSPSRLPPILKSGQFYAAYQNEIERRLSRLDQPSIVMLDLLKTLSLHYGQDNALIHWGSRSLDRIQALIVHAPRGGVAALLRAMAQAFAMRQSP